MLINSIKVTLLSSLEKVHIKKSILKTELEGYISSHNKSGFVLCNFENCYWVSRLTKEFYCLSVALASFSDKDKQLWQWFVKSLSHIPTTKLHSSELSPSRSLRALQNRLTIIRICAFNTRVSDVVLLWPILSYLHFACSCWAISRRW
jgi:hypothetical protein